MGRRKTGLDRGRTTGFYMTGRHEALIAALAAHYNRCSRTLISNSQAVQIAVEREARRLKIALPEPSAPPPAQPPAEDSAPSISLACASTHIS